MEWAETSSGFGLAPEHNLAPGSKMFWVYLAVCVVVVLFAGLMSGLTLGLLSFEEVDLLVLMKSGTETQKRHAARIMSVFRNQHWLLVTLLLCNAVAMEALPIFLNKISNEIIAIVVSVTAVLFFGEILPQSICKKFGLSIGSSFTTLVKCLMYVTGIISYPLAKLLDFLLGPNHAGVLKRKQLEALLEFHGRGEGKGGELTQDEVSIMKGALSLPTKPACMAMTPLSTVFMLQSDSVLNRSTMKTILESGYSRIPIHAPDQREDIIGLIIVKELLLLDPNDDTPILSQKVKLYSMPRLEAGVNMCDVLNIFQTGKSHMALLTYAGGDGNIDYQIEKCCSSPSSEKEPLLPKVSTDKPRIHYHMNGVAGPGVIGIITIEDVLEELLQEEIVDETDKFVDNLCLEAARPDQLMKGLHPSLQRLLKENESPSLVPLIQEQSEFLANKRRVKKQNLRASQQVEDVEVTLPFPERGNVGIRESFPSTSHPPP
mmetsp:Transcript_8716/g.22479  ORF Transcript_8716/g.22479 Transcript_8716/m.22479 type:complete len:488 (+) Transcript_8716:128-1591(+)